ncbi:hypothetical protein [Teichococcus aestuarii]|uniref:hypothetical protein n=1 Tax=Teichococcus aestuarii TaxID=568898 RepID=UPI00360D4989
MGEETASRAMVAAHTAVMRRQFALLGSSRLPAVRGMERIWCFMEAVRAAQRGTRLTQKDLYALSSGALSMATLSRAVADGVELGYLMQRPAPEDSRVRLIEPTPLGLRRPAELAPEAMEELRAVLAGEEEDSTPAAD